MAKKAKYYAVKSGKNPGIYETWDECQENVKGYKGALFKSFSTLQEAKAYLGEISEVKENRNLNEELTCYVDGSYNNKTKVAGYGAILLFDDQKECLQGTIENQDLTRLRNVAGEIEAVKAAINYATSHNFSHIDIYYDYLGIENWATGLWKTNLDYTREYADFMENISIEVTFHKVLAHSGVLYNEEVDQLAKKASGILNENKPLEELYFSSEERQYKDNYELSDEQKKALELLKDGKDIFLTGKAGTGKSYLLRHFIKLSKEAGKNVLILAPTGIAAINIHGVTIHRAFQAKTGPIIQKEIKHVPEVVQEAQIIIIDEISMCRIDLFDYVMSVINKAERIDSIKKQMVVVGDFYQLPPVTTENDRDVLSQIYKDYDKGYAFESELFKDRGFKTIELTQNQRQNNQEFVEHLNRIREGDKKAIAYFNERLDTKENNGIVLCGTNKKANEINDGKLDELKTKSKVYPSKCVGEVKDSDKPTSDQLKLKVGCKVMILVNGGDFVEYQNGSIGTVLEMMDDFIVVKLDDNGFEVEIGYYEWPIEDYALLGKEIVKRKIGSFTQLPVRLAYAITIHKSQGQTYDKVQLIPYCFDVGQLYVALSRVKTIDGLRLLSPIYDKYLITSQKVKDFMEETNNG